MPSSTASIPANAIDRLQKVQNCAARLITGADRRAHITPVLKSLHWLPVRFRIMYKINLMTFKSLNGHGPVYVKDLISMYQPSRTLRSSSHGLLSVPRFKLQTFGGRSFSVGAPTLWNALPVALRCEQDLIKFRSQLKTFYFKKAFS